jgi:hypothetical protein
MGCVGPGGRGEIKSNGSGFVSFYYLKITFINNYD